MATVKEAYDAIYLEHKGETFEVIENAYFSLVVDFLTPASTITNAHLVRQWKLYRYAKVRERDCAPLQSMLV